MKMIVVKNKIIPPAGIKALTAWPLLFVRAKYMTEQDMRHEGIHGEQQKEILCVAVVLCAVSWLAGLGWWSLLCLPLYVWLYAALWLWAYAKTGDVDEAYKANPLEREAYFFDGDTGYLDRRRWFAWWQFASKFT
jgi:hypothetical protein